MLDLGRGPLLVAVADRPAAIINSAELDSAARAFDLVEARVDLFAQQSLDGCAHDCARLEASGTPVILTIRSAAQGGRFDGTDAARLSAFSAAIAGGHASWVDVENDATIIGELAAALAARARRAADRFASRLRAHAAAGRAARASSIAAMRSRAPSRRSRPRYGARKTGRRCSSCWPGGPDRTCVIGMGASADLRIELAARGSLLAYGYLERATAPGQMSAAETHERLLAASPRYAARRPRDAPSAAAIIVARVSGRSSRRAAARPSARHAPRRAGNRPPLDHADQRRDRCASRASR